MMSDTTEEKVLDFFGEFTWHFDNHMKPALLKKKELPRNCKFCQRAIVEAQA